jgi:hypothetical protein
MRDRLGVQTLGDLALAQQRTHTRFDSTRPPGADCAGALREPLQRELEQRSVPGPGCRLGQLGHQIGSVSDRIGLHRFPGCIARGVVSSEAVVEHGSRVVVGRPSPCRRFRGGGFDQVRRLRLVATPGSENHRGVHERSVSRRLSDRAGFLDRQGGCSQLAGEHLAPRQKAQRELQVHESPRVAGGLHLASREEMQGLVVPHLERNDVAVSGARD